MVYDEIAVRLRKIESLIDGWAQSGASEIERDIVLDELSQIYRELKLGSCSSRGGVAVMQDAPQSDAVAAESCCEYVQEDEQSSPEDAMPSVLQAEFVEQESDANQQIEDACAFTPIDFELVAVGDSQETHIADKVTTTESISQTEYVEQEAEDIVIQIDMVDEADLIAESESAVVVEMPSADKPQSQESVQEMPVDESEAEFVAESGPVSIGLFGEEPMAQKKRVDRSVILSLYGDDSPTRSEVASGIKVIDHRRQPQTEVSESRESQPSVNTDSSSRVLGETFSAQPSVADGMATQMDDVASQISIKNTTSLGGSIGLNDKFLMMRDVFGGDATEYEIAVDTLERFDALDDALLYLYENHNQNPNSEGAKLLVELLTRKLS